MTGSDGKLYKVDFKNYTSDIREIYGVTQSQIATFDSPLKKSNIKTRPTSGKTTYVRPSSSKFMWNVWVKAMRFYINFMIDLLVI